MPGRQIVLRKSGTEFAALDANDYPDGQQVRITDDSSGYIAGDTWEAVGADGARTWEQAGRSATFEVLLDGDQQPVDNGQDDWLYVKADY